MRYAVALISSLSLRRNRRSQSVAAIIKSSMGLPDNVRVVSATFYREDGSIDPSRILLDDDSWKELVPYVHTLHVEDDRPAFAPSTPGLNTGASAFVPSSSSISIRTLEGTQVSLQNLRNLYSPNCESSHTSVFWDVNHVSAPPPSSPFAILDNHSLNSN